MKKMMMLIGLFVVLVVLGLLYILVIRHIGAGETGTVTVNGHILDVEIAKSLAQLSEGLSGRDNLPQDEGMLFIFSWAGKPGFWMKDMKFPLDIIWINGDKIVGIEKNVPAPSMAGGDLQSYYPPEPADKVLEINAGFSDKLGITTGQSVVMKF